MRWPNLKLRMPESLHLVVFIVREKKEEGVETPLPLCVLKHESRVTIVLVHPSEYRRTVSSSPALMKSITAPIAEQFLAK